MASPAQISANLANSKFSTGPKTPETKAISAANSQGPIAKFLLGKENPEEVENMKADLVAEFRPQSSLEHSYLDEMALARVRMLRYAEFEAALIDQALEEKRAELGPQASDAKVYAAAIRDLIDHGKTLNTLHRYQRDYSRIFERTAAKLEKARHERLQQQAVQQIQQHQNELMVRLAVTAPIPAIRQNEPNSPRKLTPEEQAKLALRL